MYVAQTLSAHAFTWGKAVVSYSDWFGLLAPNQSQFQFIHLSRTSAKTLFENKHWLFISFVKKGSRELINLSLTTSPFLLPQQLPYRNCAADFRYFVYWQSSSAGQEEERLHFFSSSAEKKVSCKVCWTQKADFDT